MSKTKIAVLGAGKMGETLISSLLQAKVITKGQVVATTKHAARSEMLAEKYDIDTTTENRQAIDGADMVLLCVKPQVVPDVLEEIRAGLNARHLVVSVAASVTTRFIEQMIGKEVPVIRAMPNTPCLLRQGMTGVCAGAFASEADLERAEFIFKQVGRTVIVDEKHMDAVTGLSASGPAFIYVVIESMAEGGVKVGLPRNVATELAAQAVLGAASMVLETGEHPALLKDVVTTPAGCTIDGLMELEEGGLRVTLIKTVVTATRRAAELMEKK
ncbi:MAG: pyrroline-5-carboxylate reductase [bacterium]